MGNSSQEDPVSKQMNENQQTKGLQISFSSISKVINSAFKNQGNQYRQIKQSVS